MELTIWYKSGCIGFYLCKYITMNNNHTKLYFEECLTLGVYKKHTKLLSKIEAFQIKSYELD